MHARAAKGIEEEVEQGVRIPVGRGFAGRIAAERRPIAITDVDHADIYNPILREKGIKSLLGVPLLADGEVIGVLHVGSLTPREFDDDERSLLQFAGERAARAIERGRLYEQRRVAEVLQQRLLPAEIGNAFGLESAARYLPAAGGSLGGDWYDLFTLAGGRVALAVGDVVGRGVEAAAIMAQLRTAVRAYAADGHPPAAVVDRVNNLMQSHGPLAMTTLVFLVIDPATETLEIVNAGHPPALVVDPSGTASYCWPQGGVPLGASATSVYTSETFPLPTGSIVLAYTDGLVERRSQSIDVGLERLRSLAEGAPDAEGLCAAIVEQLVPEAPGDDVAFIAARVPPLGDELTTRWDATPDSLAPIRYLLRRWLLARGATEDEAFDVIVASQEACANAIEHAYGPGHAEFAVDASYADGRVTVTVTDRGHWRAPRGSNRGRGLPLMRELMDTVDVSHSEHGTAVTLVTHARERARVNLLAQVTEERHGGVSVTRVTGEVDASNARWLEDRLRAPLTNQLDALVVDLTATTYLDSTGIALLFGLATELRQHQQQLRLVVAEDSPIARMVRLTGLSAAVPTAPSPRGGARGVVVFPPCRNFRASSTRCR